MTDLPAPSRPRLGVGFWTFIAFMLALTVLFAILGVWQVERLGEKEALIAEVDARLHQAPEALPPVQTWRTLDPQSLTFHPVTVTGHFLADKASLVFTSLSDDAKGHYNGPGYWVMVPFVTAEGGTVYVNRGFVPQGQGPDFVKPSAIPSGQQTVTGVALAPEASGPFTPPPDTAHNIEWVRDPTRIAKLLNIDITKLAPFTIDVVAGAPNALPQGGETVVDFPNNHLGYAMTWFGFALLTPALLAVWIRRQVRPKPEPRPTAASIAA
jgi:surfeit locus 1 family protein